MQRIISYSWLAVILALIACSKQDNAKVVEMPVEQQKVVEQLKVVEQKEFIKFTLDKISGDKLINDFDEVPLQRIYEQLKDTLNIAARKGEFQTTEEVKQRLKEVEEKTYVEKLTVKDLLAFRVPVNNYGKIKTKYDADSQIAMILVSGTSVPSGFSKAVNTSGKIPNRIDFLQLDFDVTTGKTEGQNSFGVKRDVDVNVSVTYGIASKSISFLKYDRTNQFTETVNDSNLFTVKVDRNVAPAFLKDLEAIVIVRLRDPYLIANSFGIAPTMDRPQAYSAKYKFLFGDVLGIVIYKKSNNEILKRIPATLNK